MKVDVAESHSAKEVQFFTEQAESGKYSLCGVIASGRPENAGFDAYLDDITSPRLKALRRVLHTVDDSISQGTAFRKNIQLLGQRELPFDLCISPSQHTVGIELIDACPDTQFVLDHCGNPNISEPSSFAAWQQTLTAIAERSNVTAKLSGIVASGTADCINLEAVQPYLDATLEAFGHKRLVWGSDWPVCELTTELPTWIKIFRKWLNQFSDEEQQAIANLNAKKLYKI
jgi:predicted TIM-barrel fold metal-dependent hydrolase